MSDRIRKREYPQISKNWSFKGYVYSPSSGGGIGYSICWNGIFLGLLNQLIIMIGISSSLYEYTEWCAQLINNICTI